MCDAKKGQAITRQRASNPTLQCFLALVGFCTMKSIVASAMEFMIAETNPFGASRIGPFARHRSNSSAIFAMVLWPAARVAGVISSETPSCASARLFSGLDTAQRIQLDQI